MDMYKITRQICLVEPAKSTEKIVASSRNVKKFYDIFGESLMLTTKDFLGNLTSPENVIECEVLFLKKRTRIRGFVASPENLLVLRYLKNQIQEEKNTLFLSEYLFEENGIEEGEPAALIKDITKKPLRL
ncbi:MAG: hypothetical protein QXL86_02395 [Candidatus Aenigmatarchaeota archaeon]